MRLIQILYHIYNHPLNAGNRLRSIFKFFHWQLFTRLFKYPVILPFTESSRYVSWNGLTGITGNWYYGLMELDEMSFAVHLLREADVFYDIGANVGSYSILVSQHSKSHVFSFEPHPKTFEILKLNIAIQQNPSLITAYNLALGDKQGVIKFSKSLDTVNHVLTDLQQDGINVELSKLDIMYLEVPVLMKIDVEGYELFVLEGARNILSNSILKAIIIEINGSGFKYGIGNEKIDELLNSYGFFAHKYSPFERKIEKLQKFNITANTIYVRDLEFCQSRVSSAPKIKLANNSEI